MPRQSLHLGLLNYSAWVRKITFVTGIILLVGLFHKGLMNDYIVIGALLGTFMFLKCGDSDCGLSKKLFWV